MLKVGGENVYGQLCVDSNNKSTSNYPVVSPADQSNIDISSIISYSVYCDHSIWITQEGKARAAGDNSGGRIHGSLPKEKLVKWTEFEIIDKKGNHFDIRSAVCGLYYSLYLVQLHNESDNSKLAYVYYNKNGGMPLFLDIGDRCPIALFGGYKTSASINNDGSITIITKNVFNSPTALFCVEFLPNNEKSIGVACCDRFVVALSSTGKVYSLSTMNDSRKSNFKEVDHLKGIKFVQISGTFDFCLIVSEDNRVFRCDFGTAKGFDVFTEMQELKNQKIFAAYCGYNHCLFQNNEGKILACGNNDYGQLLFKTGPNSEDVVSPSETSISGGATFCIAGYQLSAVYVINDPPINSPNKETLNIRKRFVNDLSNFDIQNDQIVIKDSEGIQQSRCCLLI